ncbi:uncharacterized protein H6S33_007176 [Morchella sextelata]|uniref:uncharacterized protein n=1 Tax=Morchella sextelata TaxID=1174677 RepID=UPI001D038EF4|nr:uncharacterized protein H6S33_007176 [Morchella sextelata]KAH0604145.1 hypothetical protein H6S33_007176 [Morchella sextelata]
MVGGCIMVGWLQISEQRRREMEMRSLSGEISDISGRFYAVPWRTFLCPFTIKQLSAISSIATAVQYCWVFISLPRRVPSELLWRDTPLAPQTITDVLAMFSYIHVSSLVSRPTTSPTITAMPLSGKLFFRPNQIQPATKTKDTTFPASGRNPFRWDNVVLTLFVRWV